MASLDSEIDRLFSLPRERFVKARDELATRLRGEGKDEDARAVKSLRRPTLAAATANELARTHPDEVDALLRAGASLRAAQEEAIGGGSGGRLREATGLRREILERLGDAAAAILERDGTASNRLDDVLGTLEAASVDEGSGELLRRGRLSEALAPADIDPFASGPATRSGTKRGRSEARGVEPVGAARRERENLARAAAEARRAADRAMRAADEATAEAERRERRAREAADRAADARERARALVSDARKAAKDAERKERAAAPGGKARSTRRG